MVAEVAEDRTAPDPATPPNRGLHLAEDARLAELLRAYRRHLEEPGPGSPPAAYAAALVAEAIAELTRRHSEAA